ncbi:hypothetical protein [Actinomycetospora chibensis]|uniref:Uncharacterized protein n=1 Tax=Actinomycetospora chibensis TaxID=663606 RepID=A0ABV9RFV2_9PSEU|nr:hypothetical protein [Actinomycetospora chibensis]MDD7922448.1 hypothetical protein [Actinomycetospora chibensis]
MNPDAAGPAARGPFEDGPSHLVAEIDLAMEVTDTSGRHTSGRLVGTGHRLHLEVTDPAVVVAAAGRGATQGVSARLAAAGVRAELHGPRGRVAMIDPERSSRVGRLLTGSPHVTLDRAGWALPVRAALPPGAARVGRVAAAVVVVVVGLGLARSRRRLGFLSDTFQS